MGTSTSNPGQKGGTPLIPSWLDDGDFPPQPQAPDRFTTPRADFTRFINDNKSGNSGSTRHLSRAASRYVRNSLGGSSNATTRLGAARTSAVRMFSVFNSIIKRGVDETFSSGIPCFHTALYGKSYRRPFDQ